MDEEVIHFNIRSCSIPLFSNRFLWLAGGIFVNELHFQASGTGIISLDLDTIWRISLCEACFPAVAIFSKLPMEIFHDSSFSLTYSDLCHEHPCHNDVKVCLVARMFSPHPEQCFRVIQEFSCSCWCLFLNSTHASSYRWDLKGDSHSHLSEQTDKCITLGKKCRIHPCCVSQPAHS